ncbi:MAG: beta-propeller fold lactonase family protein [Anaerolineae bacterium]|nr:beta-propeller fold lactonase family protein [Anaerolineae bacterium]
MAKRICLGLLLLFLFLLLSLGSQAAEDTPPAAKRSSSPIALTPDGATLLVVNPDSNSLTLVDTASRLVLAEVPVGVDPCSVAVSPDSSRAYVANQDTDSLSVVDIAARAVIADIVVGDRPVGVAVSADGRFVAIAELGVDRVRLLDVANLSTLSVTAVADRPYGLAFTPDGQRLLVTHLLSGDVTVLWVQPYRAYLPIILKGQGTRSLNTPSNPQPPMSNLQSQIPTWPNVAPAPAVLVNAAGTRAYLPQTMANGLGYNTSFDTTVFPKVSVLSLETLSHQTSEHISLPETDRPVGLPWDVALAKGDAELWVVNSASNDVSVINIGTPTHPARVAHIPVGDNPRGIVLAPDGNRAYVNNTLAGTVSVIDTSAYTVTDVLTVTTLPLPPVLLHGKRLFFSSARPDLARAAWISCNTCHVEAEHDGRTWLLQYTGPVPPGELPVIRRNTTSLLGMIETYPLRWSAEWDESADSEFSIRFEQFGSGLIEGDMHPTLGTPNQGRSYDLDRLALFLDGLSLAVRAHTLTEAELRGKVVFESPQTECTACHPAPLYTDLQVHDVGTADGPGEWFGPLIDTPTLRFLYDSAPYLHDGSAATLYDVLTSANPDDEHGVTSHLTEDELADLIAFLLALPLEE